MVLVPVLDPVDVTDPVSQGGALRTEGAHTLDHDRLEGVRREPVVVRIDEGRVELLAARVEVEPVAETQVGEGLTQHRITRLHRLEQQGPVLVRIPVNPLRGVARHPEGDPVEKKGRFHPDQSARGDRLARASVESFAIEGEGAEVELEMRLRGGVAMHVEMPVAHAEPEALVELGLSLLDRRTGRAGCAPDRSEALGHELRRSRDAEGAPSGKQKGEEELAVHVGRHAGTQPQLAACRTWTQRISLGKFPGGNRPEARRRHRVLPIAGDSAHDVGMRPAFPFIALLLTVPGLRSAEIPFLDLADDHYRQVVVDHEAGQYLGHPTTALLDDGRTILTVYPKGHGRGGIVYKRSTDGGLTWSERLPTPESWLTSREVPTLHRMTDASGKKRIVMFSGLHPVRMAVTEDEGKTWSELAPVGDWGGIVTMGCDFEVRGQPGCYRVLFHDDGRFFRADSKQKKPVVFTLYSSTTSDGGLTWSEPSAIFASSDVHLCEPGVIRSPDGKRLAVLLRENSRKKNSHLIVSDDEGATWSAPRELPVTLTGDRHTGRYGPDGRLLISFRGITPGRSRARVRGNGRPPPHGRRLGRLGRDVGRSRVRRTGPIRGAPHGQSQGRRHGLSGSRGPARRDLRARHLRPLDRGREP